MDIRYNSQRHQFLVAYEIGSGLFQLQLLTIQGNLAWDPPLIILYSGERPAIAYNSALDQYLLVWQEHDALNSVYNINDVYLSSNGHSAIGSIFSISTSAWDHQRPAVAFNNHGSYQDYLVVWQENHFAIPIGWWEVWAQQVAGTSGGAPGGGNLIGTNFPVADNPVTILWSYYEPDVAYNLNRNEYMPAVAAYRLNQNTPYLVAYTDYWNDPSGDVRAYLVDVNGQPQTLLNIAATTGRQEEEPDVASSEGLGGYTTVWSQWNDDWNIYGRRVNNTATMEPSFDISRYGFVVVPCHEQVPAIAGGSPVALAVWQDNCLGGGGSWKIAGRLLGYQMDLPLILKNHQ